MDLVYECLTFAQMGQFLSVLNSDIIETIGLDLIIHAADQSVYWEFDEVEKLFCINEEKTTNAVRDIHP